MTRRKSRNHSPAFKAKVALAVLKGEKTPAVRSDQLDVHVNIIQDWNKQLLEGAQDVFGSHTVDALHVEREVEKLHAKVGRLTVHQTQY